MNYWRMQLHPNDADNSTFYSSQSISAGFIGLDFSGEIGDLLSESQEKILSTQKKYLSFALDMKIGDKVLVISHHFPFAVVTIEGEYNYMRRVEPELGVWFRHFRRIKDPIYYSDFKTNAKSWEQYTMTDTISILRDENSKSFKLIKEMTV